MGLFSKKGEIPDVGQEEEFEATRKGKKKVEEEPEEKDVEEEIVEEEKPEKKQKKGKFNDEEIGSFELQKINARLEALDSLIKSYSERFSAMSGQIGEVRAMTLENEKEITKAIQAGGMAVDIVKEVKPERLRSDYQKADLKMQELAEKIDAGRQFSDTIMNELKDLRRKAGIFIGTDALLNLNEEIKKDLIEVQKLDSRVRVNADKCEQLFIEMRSNLAQNEKLAGITTNLDNSYSGLQKEIEKIKVDYSSIVKESELSDFKRNFDGKILAVENAIQEVDEMKEKSEKMEEMVETTLSIAKKNKEDIADLAVTIGDSHIKRISDYDERLNAILQIIDTLAGNIAVIKKKLGLKMEKIEVKHDDSGKLKNMDIHPKIVKSLEPEKAEIPEAVARIQKESREKIPIIIHKQKKPGIKPRKVKKSEKYIKKVDLKKPAVKIVEKIKKPIAKIKKKLKPVIKIKKPVIKIKKKLKPVKYSKIEKIQKEEEIKKPEVKIQEQKKSENKSQEKEEIKKPEIKKPEVKIQDEEKIKEDKEQPKKKFLSNRILELRKSGNSEE
jgi:hypothetical protein